MTLEDVAWTATERHRFRAVLVMTFAGLALTLAMVGVFGVVGYAVQQRLRDFAVRRALGATAGDVVRLVVGGVAPGASPRASPSACCVAAALGRMLGTVLVGRRSARSADLRRDRRRARSLSALLAIAGPARRAVRPPAIDPR